MSKPRVYIVESLRFEDEKNHLQEGAILSKMLKLSDSRSEYVYLRTKKELEEVVDHFEDSEYRYLHISCHGNKKGIALTLDDLSFEELGELLGPVLEKRRVFFSSCEVVNKRLAAALLAETGCYSVVGPSAPIEFDRAAAFWSAFYHLVLRDGASSIKRVDVQQRVSQLQAIFGVQMRYFSTSNSADGGFKEVAL